MTPTRCELLIMSLLRFPTAALAVGLAVSALAAGCGDEGEPVGVATTPAATAPAESTPSEPEAAAPTETEAEADPAPAQPAAGGDGELTPVKDGVVEVAYRGFIIEPEALVVKSGQKIRWTNFDTTRHNVIVKPGAPEEYTGKDFDDGETDEHAFTKPGDYAYLCTFHAASMQGTIKVVE